MAKKATPPAAPKAAKKVEAPVTPARPARGRLWFALWVALVTVAFILLLATVMAWVFQPGPAAQPTSAPPLACPPFMEGHPLDAQQSAAQGECVYGDIPGVTVTPLPEAVPTAAPTVTVAPIVPPTACRDGELILVHAADEGDVLDRLPVGEAERVNIVEIGVPGRGFGGYDRFIIVVPRLGSVWQVNITAGTRTIASRGFCGKNEAVASWAVTAHVPSLQQASRDSHGNQPPTDEIGVYILNYEAGTLTELKPGRLSATEVLKWIDVSFHEGTNVANVPLVAP